MIRSLKLGGRVAVLWVAMLIGTVLSGSLVHPTPHAGIPDGPFSVLAAMLLVNGFGAVIISGLASNLAAGGVRKAAFLFVVVFALETGLSWIEAAAFRRILGLDAADLTAIIAAGAIRAAVAAAAAALLWPRAGTPAPPLARRLVALIGVLALYPVFYFAAGFFVAWRSEAVRDFYRGGRDINVAALAALQCVRGLLWTSLAFLLAANLRGRTIAVAAWTALAFVVLMVAPLLYPNVLMPWAVREAHIVELAVANGAFGLLAVLLFRRSPKTSAPALRRENET